MGIGDWGLGVWGVGVGGRRPSPHPTTPQTHTQHPKKI